jgi:hypothetical protein
MERFWTKRSGCFASCPKLKCRFGASEMACGHLDGASVSFDLADLRGYAYYSGAMFSMYAPGASDALARGGRYDEVGSCLDANVRLLVLAWMSRL